MNLNGHFTKNEVDKLLSRDRKLMKSDYSEYHYCIKKMNYIVASTFFHNRILSTESLNVWIHIYFSTRRTI